MHTYPGFRTYHVILPTLSLFQNTWKRIQKIGNKSRNMPIFLAIFLHLPFIFHHHQACKSIKYDTNRRHKTITISEKASKKPELRSSHRLSHHPLASQARYHAHRISPLPDSQDFLSTTYENKMRHIHLSLSPGIFPHHFWIGIR